MVNNLRQHGVNKENYRRKDESFDFPPLLLSYLSCKFLPNFATLKKNVFFCYYVFVVNNKLLDSQPVWIPVREREKKKERSRPGSHLSMTLVCECMSFTYVP